MKIQNITKIYKNSKYSYSTWSFYNPVKISFGFNLFEKKLKSALNNRPFAFITYNDSFFKDIENQAEKLLEKQPVFRINNIETYPTVSMLKSASETHKKTILDNKDLVLICIGGGSVIDFGKLLIGLSPDFQKNFQNLSEGKNVPITAKTKILAIPTTSGTGSEMTMWAAIWDFEKNKKWSLSSEELYCEQAIVDPLLTINKPKDLTISTGLDALSHAFESIWNKNANPISNDFAINSIKLNLEFLPQLIQDLKNEKLRYQIAKASLLAGFAFSNTKTALAHNISYPVTIQKNIPHGIACSFTIPWIFKNTIGVSQEIDKVFEYIFETKDLKGKGYDKLINYFIKLGVSTNFQDYSLSENDFKLIIDDGLQGERGKNFILSQININ